MFGILLLFSTPMIAPAQDACPTLTVSPSSADTGKASFSAMLSGGDNAVQPTFNWSISAGTIAAGQGTSSISVAGKPGEIVTASVDVGGYPRECPASQSATTDITAIDASACPNFGIEQAKGPKGETIFNATADKTPDGTPTIHWWLSKEGTIVSGQGTGSITVKAPAGTKLQTAYMLTGLSPACKDRVIEDFMVE